MRATFYRHTNSATLHLHPGPTADAVTRPASGQAVTASGLVSPEEVACSAAVGFGDRAVLDDGGGFREYVRVSAVRLEDIVARLESDYALLERLDVVRNDTAIEIGAQTGTVTLSARVTETSPVTGQWASVLQPPGLPSTALTRGLSLLRVFRLSNEQPVEVRALHTDATELGVRAEDARALLLRLVRDRYMVTQLRAPGTVIDPLGYLLDQLDQVHASSIASIAPLVAELRDIHTALRHHTTISGTAPINDADGRVRSLQAIADRIHALASTARRDHDGSAHDAAPGAAVTVHRRLAASIQLPQTLLSDAEQAATALYRLGRRPVDPVWADYHQRFLARYGTGLLVPVTALLHPAVGLGYPAGYPDSQYPVPQMSDAARSRDAALLALAMSTYTEPHVGDGECAGVREVVLDDATIAAITPPSRTEPAAAPPHLDIAVTVHAPTIGALTGGHYQLHVRAAAPAGTWTAASALDTLDDDIAAATRDDIDAYTDFTQIIRDPVSRALRDAPPDTLDATRVQLSHATVAPSHPHPERRFARQLSHQHGGGVSTALPLVTRLGEYPAWSVPHKVEAEVLELRYIAVFATSDRLHLATLNGTVLDPQLFTEHDAAPPLARFLAGLNAGFAPPVTAFEWGPVADELPHLPRVRYGRVILSPARWRITTHTLHASANASGADVVDALHAFFRRWDCPTTVDLIDQGDDEGRRLTLTNPAHVDLLTRHIEMHGEAIVTETLHSTSADGGSGDSGLGVLARPHELVLPLVRRAAPAASPVLPDEPPFTYTGAHGHLPGDINVDSWTLVKVFTDPSLMSTLITDALPTLSDITAPSRLWFSRHPATSVDPAHLRVHLQALPGTDPATTQGTHEDTDEDTDDELIEPDVLDDARGLLALVTDWADGLVKAKLTGRIEYATYVPDEGVFGESLVLEDADTAHVAGSALVTALLTEWARTPTPPANSGEAERDSVTAAGMVHLARAFLGYEDLAYRWLATQTPTSGQPSHLDMIPPGATDARTNPVADLETDPKVVARVVTLAATDPRHPHPELPPTVRQRWAELADAVTAYGRHAPPHLRDHALTALLHAHANRLGTLTADSRVIQHCLQLARMAAAVLLDDTGATS